MLKKNTIKHIKKTQKRKDTNEEIHKKSHPKRRKQWKNKRNSQEKTHERGNTKK